MKQRPCTVQNSSLPSTMQLSFLSQCGAFASPLHLYLGTWGGVCTSRFSQILSLWSFCWNEVLDSPAFQSDSCETEGQLLMLLFFVDFQIALLISVPPPYHHHPILHRLLLLPRPKNLWHHPLESISNIFQFFRDMSMYIYFLPYK